MQLDWPSFLLNRVVVDIMGPLPRTERGNKYIIVITVYSIEWVKAFAIPNMTTRTVSTASVDGCFCQNGARLKFTLIKGHNLNQSCSRRFVTS